MTTGLVGRMVLRGLMRRVILPRLGMMRRVILLGLGLVAGMILLGRRCLGRSGVAMILMLGVRRRGGDK
jgi:hypothetical protein